MSTDCVQVAVRVRPFVDSERNRGCVQILKKVSNEPQITITGDSNSKTQDTYTFNNVFMPDDSQDVVYEDCIKPILPKLFDGYNVTILAYGQTGSGKTYTMGTVFDGDWTSNKVGIIPRALRDIFQSVRKMEDHSTISITCSFMELYRETLYDLLTDRSRDQSVCEIREDGAKGIIINGLCEIPSNDEDKATNCLMTGGSKRTVGATAMNDASSRSHAIFVVNVKAVRLDGSGNTTAKFTLVDLAGSERSKKTKATGTRFKEGVKINQGLLALGNVISALGGGSVSSNGYISYRDSKLTRLLQDSLGGNSVTLMVACVSPADYNIEETLSTLRYADRAKKIKNKPVKNENSDQVEIQKLKQIIQELRLQVLDKNPTVGFEDNELACKKMQAKDKEISDLRTKLSTIINTLNELSALHILDESFINDIITEFEKLCTLLFTTCAAEFAMPDTKIFDQLKAQANIIEELIKKYKQQLRETSEENKLTIQLNDEIDSEKYMEYTNNQIEMYSKISALEREMKIKQELLDRKFQNTPLLIDNEADKTMIEYTTKIETLEKEINDLKSANMSSAARRDVNATKVNMDRKHKLEKMEKELTEIRKKCVALEKTKKMAEQDKKRCEDLKREIQEMKTARVQLIRQQRNESDTYKRYIANRDKEINCLKEKEKKVQNEMKRMERLHEKQQSVLKRKFEEAKAINKRLQDAVDTSRKNQKARMEKAIEKTDVVQNYIDHELVVLISTVDAKNAMQSLMNDRGMLLERLQNLKSTVNKNDAIEKEILQLEEDLEMRNAQITDMRAKLMETDIDAKIKNIPENFTSVPELRIAMTYILRALLDSREDFITNKTKAEDLKAAYDASEDRIEQLLEEKSEMLMNFEEEKNQMERDFEQKITYLCQKQNGNLNKEDEDKCFTSLTEQLTAKIEENAILKLRIEDLEKEKLNDKKAEKKKKIKQEAATPNGTFVIDSNSDESSDDEEFDFNDSFKDPDWKKTPKHKRGTRSTTTLLKESLVNRMDGTNMLINISETSNTSQGTKRKSGGNVKCACKGSCATKLCGCKKTGFFCSDNCKCSEACVNTENTSKESADENQPQTKKQRESDEHEVTPEKNKTKVDFNNITTPYYPYQTKKRRPLLPVE
ncbi:chromosome-associated kinesin KIF4 [Chironomus tepperi]|uniref:chromosome-associated kinesin KIF4 n=1 Tax=Chironomus tepperi TaxID=113505 RepID=UPI00391F2B19